MPSESKPVDKASWADKLAKAEPVVVEGDTSPLHCRGCGDPIKGSYSSRNGDKYHMHCVHMQHTPLQVAEGMKAPERKEPSVTGRLQDPHTPCLGSIWFVEGDVREPVKVIRLEENDVLYTRLNGLDISPVFIMNRMTFSRYFTWVGDSESSYNLGNTKGVPTPSGRKDDTGKARWDLLPLDVLSDVVDVLTFGATKYAPDNWQHVPQPRSRYLAACMRHLVSYQTGEALDRETGKHHLAHAICCLVFLLWFERQGK
jgi:hypothetical protein